MNLDSLSFALSNISYSVANLTKKNFKSSVQEISRVSIVYNSKEWFYLHLDSAWEQQCTKRQVTEYYLKLIISSCCSIVATIYTSTYKFLDFLKFLLIKVNLSDRLNILGTPLIIRDANKLVILRRNLEYICYDRSMTSYSLFTHDLLLISGILISQYSRLTFLWFVYLTFLEAYR